MVLFDFYKYHSMVLLNFKGFNQMEYKQPAIISEIKRRVNTGVYNDLLPTSIELAAEFGVNFKTINKAIAQLVTEGLLERKRKSGTRIRQTTDNKLIEVIFEGFTTIFSHPFWSEIWTGMVDELAVSGYRPILNMLDSDPETGLLKLDGFSMMPTSGKIILGIEEKRLLNQVAAMGAPFITACDRIDDPAIPQIAFDFKNGMSHAVNFLFGIGCRRIAFIGQTQSYISNGAVHKFDMYRRAIQKYMQIDPVLIENVRPLANNEIAGINTLLERTSPDALIAAYDHQLPEILKALEERAINIPVIGCDGLNIPGIPEHRHVIVAPRRQCGEILANNLIKAIHQKTAPASKILQAEFK